MRTILIAALIAVFASPVDAVCNPCAKVVSRKVVAQKAVKQLVVKEPQVVQRIQNFYQAVPGYQSYAAGQAYSASLAREFARLTEQMQYLEQFHQQQQQYRPMVYQPYPQQYAPQTQCNGQCQLQQPVFRQQQIPSAVNQHCMQCHSTQKRKGGVDLSDPSRLSPEEREKALDAIDEGRMPKGGDLSLRDQLRVKLELDDGRLAEQIVNYLTGQKGDPP